MNYLDYDKKFDHYYSEQDLELNYNQYYRESPKITLKSVGLTIIIIFITYLGADLVMYLSYREPAEAVSRLYNAVYEKDLNGFKELILEDDNQFADLDIGEVDQVLHKINEFYTREYGEDWRNKFIISMGTRTQDEAFVSVSIESGTESNIDDLGPLVSNQTGVVSVKVIRVDGEWLIKGASL